MFRKFFSLAACLGKRDRYRALYRQIQGPEKETDTGPCIYETSALCTKRTLYLRVRLCETDDAMSKEVLQQPYFYEKSPASTKSSHIYLRNRLCNTDLVMSKEMSKESCICGKSPISAERISKDPISTKEISKKTYIEETGDVILTTQCQKKCQKSLVSVKRALCLRKRFQKTLYLRKRFPKRPTSTKQAM